MKIITLNVNGIRSATKKGVFRWFAEQDADVICLQEVRANPLLLSEEQFQLPGYYCFYQSADKGGYSGVGLFCRKEPDHVVTQLGFPLCDTEGRYIHVELGDLIIASLYMPSGTSGEHRQISKFEFMDTYQTILENQLQSNKKFIICGDWNIAHKKIDLKNWSSNQKHSGFLPEERAWLDLLFDQMGYIDAFREVNQGPHQYTWWSNFGHAWENNTGWRIDYQVLSPNLKHSVQHASIYKDARFSDHAPLTIEYNL